MQWGGQVVLITVLSSGALGLILAIWQANKTISGLRRISDNIEHLSSDVADAGVSFHK